MWEKILLIFLKEELFHIKLMYLKQKKKNQKKKESKKFIKYIENDWKSINYDLFKKHFNSNVPTALIKQLYETKNRKKNKTIVDLIKSGLKDLKEEIKEMSEEREIEKSHKIVEIIEEYLNFNNKQNQINRKSLKNFSAKQNGK